MGIEQEWRVFRRVVGVHRKLITGEIPSVSGKTRIPGGKIPGAARALAEPGAVVTYLIMRKLWGQSSGDILEACDGLEAKAKRD